MIHLKRPILSAGSLSLWLALTLNASLAAQTETVQTTSPPPLVLPKAPSTIHKVQFGSCLDNKYPFDILEQMLRDQPDLFVFTGDIIYGDTTVAAKLARSYEVMDKNLRLQAYRQQVPMIAIWDDHDYGGDDIGEENPIKNEARQYYLDFLREPQDSPRRTQAGGIYTSAIYGAEGERVQFILLDGRWSRKPLLSMNKFLSIIPRLGFRKVGPYLKHPIEYHGMMADEQWTWLEQELSKPADIRVIISGVQILADGTGWESWSNFPGDRQRLLDLVSKASARSLFLVSGDTHWSEFSKVGDKLPLIEMTASALNQTWQAISPNIHRIDAKAYGRPNYGRMQVDWSKGEILLQIIDAQGQEQMRQALPLSKEPITGFGR